MSLIVWQKPRLQTTGPMDLWWNCIPLFGAIAFWTTKIVNLRRRPSQSLLTLVLSLLKYYIIITNLRGSYLGGEILKWKETPEWGGSIIPADLLWPCWHFLFAKAAISLSGCSVVFLRLSKLILVFKTSSWYSPQNDFVLLPESCQKFIGTIIRVLVQHLCA